MRLATTKHTNSSSRQTISRIFITLPAEIPAISTGVLSCISRGIYSALLQEDPDAFPLLPEKTLYILRECTHKKNVKDADRLYRFIVGNGLQCYSFWADHIIPLFGFSGTLQQAVQAFHRVVHPTVQTWRAIIALHIKFAKSSMVLSLYDLMLTNAVAPDRVTYLHAIQACGLESALSSGMRIHNHVIEDGYDSNSSVANTLIDMYSKCGQMDEACCVFNHLSSKSVVSWGALIGGYSKKGQCHKVFELVIKMQQNKVKINNIIISCILKSCNTPESLAEGRLTHILAINGGVESDSLATRALINMYISCNSLQDAQSVFDSTKQIDMKSWGTMTAGYAQSGLGDAACQLFQEMQQNGHQLDRVILLCMVQACQSTESSKEGRLIHQRILKEGFETYIHLGNALIDMHVVRGSLEDAQNVFDRLVTKDVISWAAIISGYVQHDCSEVALSLFDSMQESHIEPDILIYLWVLKACAKLRSLGPGISLHNDILYKGFESDISVCGSLIDMYSGCGSLEEALFLFNSVSDPSIVLWGAMISGCVQHGHDLLALDLFKRMQRQGLQPDTALSTSLLKACSRTGSIEEGRILHRNLDRHELKLNTTLANCIIDMYSKCGSIAEAHETFESLPTRGVSCWSTMIIAYIEANLIHPAFDLIDKMLEEGISPDKTLFLHLCKTCGQIKATGWANLVF
ncbi:hypothetical protein KP509_1Z307800 [Ceratopteris richardii]|nr:hypothetical protein KP509_1Z307800 [Ceratopteris richardii]